MGKERKYSPSFLHVLVAGRLYLEEDLKSKLAAGGEMPTNDVRIFIRNSENNSRCYQIAYEPDGQTHIWEGGCAGSIWREMPRSILFENRDKLGEVIVKRNLQRIKEYQTFDEFWNDIKRD
jgi:hypothetical protein